MESTRQQKISRLIQKEIGNYFLREGQSIYSGKMVTVTGAKVTPDLSIARIYISIFPSNKSKDVLSEIVMHTKSIRNFLGREVRNQLRIIPNLEFFIDDSLDYIGHIDELLKK
jgi:ribosome-binding factor A